MEKVFPVECNGVFNSLISIKKDIVWPPRRGTIPPREGEEKERRKRAFLPHIRS
jgi:hypothetical protein